MPPYFQQNLQVNTKAGAFIWWIFFLRFLAFHIFLDDFFPARVLIAAIDRNPPQHAVPKPSPSAAVQHMHASCLTEGVSIESRETDVKFCSTTDDFVTYDI